MPAKSAVKSIAAKAGPDKAKLKPIAVVPDVAQAVCDAIRAACPGVIINLTTGVIGKDISGPTACLERVRPEIAACNAGTLRKAVRPWLIMSS